MKEVRWGKFEPVFTDNLKKEKERARNLKQLVAEYRKEDALIKANRSFTDKEIEDETIRGNGEVFYVMFQAAKKGLLDPKPVRLNIVANSIAEYWLKTGNQR